MKLKTILILFAFIIIFCIASAKEETKWGVVFIDGKAAYIDPTQLDMSEMGVSNNIITKNKIANNKSIKNGKIIWAQDRIIVSDSNIDSPTISISGTRIEYKYKVDHNVMFLSEDGKTWEVLQISIVDDKEKQIGGKFKYPQHMIIHLKCKWFENDYALIGTIGS
ncbi:MAG TPA: hypothetical protein PK624_03955 [Spirochaetota bacterium]|nr:hypothetical protein [Spirochaetota bacterium]HOR43928.1 hypothetical protein [Spirochaetota bacterium]HOU85062.1 hypothetical protein [Spirochaetota bacterium]HPK55352.1 hypothetical protein [Spirochaetota bacterium]HQE59440.1 hypothetical protein [Spirochaetota bacterium]